MRRISAEAPTRVDFAGGPSDVNPFRNLEGGMVVATAISKMVRVQVSERSDREIHINSADIASEYIIPDFRRLGVAGPLSLVEACLIYSPPHSGLNIEIQVQAPVGSGLGTSSACCIALLRALEVYKAPLSVLDVEATVAASLVVENELLGNTTGGQDQYTSALGGFRAYEFRHDTVVGRGLRIRPAVVKELQDRSVICYSGASRVSGTLLDEIMDKYITGDIAVTRALRDMKELAGLICEALESGDLNGFGSLMRAVGETQSRLSDSLTPPTVRDILKLAYANGAVGGRMVGAGGGGCVYFFCEAGFSTALRDKITAAGFDVMSVAFSRSGLHCEEMVV